MKLNKAKHSKTEVCLHRQWEASKQDLEVTRMSPVLDVR